DLFGKVAGFFGEPRHLRRGHYCVPVLKATVVNLPAGGNGVTHPAICPVLNLFHPAALDTVQHGERSGGSLGFSFRLASQLSVHLDSFLYSVIYSLLL